MAGPDQFTDSQSVERSKRLRNFLEQEDVAFVIDRLRYLAIDMDLFYVQKIAENLEKALDGDASKTPADRIHAFVMNHSAPQDISAELEIIAFHLERRIGIRSFVKRP